MPEQRQRLGGELEGLLTAGASPNPWSGAVILFAIETGMRRVNTLPDLENVHLGSCKYLPDTKNGDSRDGPLTPGWS